MVIELEMGVGIMGRAILGVVGFIVILVIGVVEAEPGKKIYVILLFFGVTIFIGILVLLDLRYKGKRSKRLKEKADEFGWSFEKSLSDELTEKYLVLFDIIRLPATINPRISNYISGDFKGEKFTFFDHYATLMTSGGVTGNNSFVIIHNPTKNIPDFAVNYSKSKFDKLMGDGSKHIDLTEYPVFNEHYTLRGNNENKIRKLFTPEIIEVFESSAPKLSWLVEVRGNDIICRRWGLESDPEIQPEEMNDFFSMAIKIRDILEESASLELVSS